MQEEIKRKEEERKRKEEEKRKKQEEKNGKRTVFSYDKIEKSKIKDIDLNDYDKQLFYDDNSENSDEEVLNNLGKKIERNEIVDDKIKKEEILKNQIQNSNEENNKNKELEYINDEEIEENIEKKTNEIPKRAKYSLNENYEREINNNINENIRAEERYTKEQQIYDNIRLTKSSEVIIFIKILNNLILNICVDVLV